MMWWMRRRAQWLMLECVSLQLRGYVGSFDLRDYGTFTLQIQLGWFFGAGEPGAERRAIQLGAYMGLRLGDCDLMRSLVGGRRPIGVALTQRDSDAAAMVTSPRFGTEKCVRGDVAGRLVDVTPLGRCRPPYCSSSTPGRVFDIDDLVRVACYDVVFRWR